MEDVQSHSWVLPVLEAEISAANCSIFLFRLLISARNSSILEPRISSRFEPLRSTRIESLVRSETLRAPVTEQRRLRAEYSSSERRTLIMRVRGFRTVMGIAARDRIQGNSGNLRELGKCQAKDEDRYQMELEKSSGRGERASPPSAPTLWRELKKRWRTSL